MREKTKYVGVYARKHGTRRHLGRQDICYDITYKDSAGKKIWIKIGWASEGITAAMAHATRAEKVRMQREIPAHALPSSTQQSNLTFAEAFAIYARDHLPKVKHATFAYNQYKYVAATIGNVSLNAITTHDIDRLIGTMQGQGYSAQTIKHAIGIVQRVYRKLTAWGLYSGSIPTEGCSLPRIDAARVRFLTIEEAQNLMQALKAKSFTWYAISFISLHTGMRIGEILQLKWEDIDFETRSIYIREAKSGSRAAIMTLDVKELFLSLKERYVDTNIIFTAKEVSKTFPRCVAALGLNDNIADRRQRVVFHTLRHTFASWLAIKGVPLYVISQLLGHKSLEMTQRYAHLCPDVKRDAVNMLDGLIGHK